MGLLRPGEYLTEVLQLARGRGRMPAEVRQDASFEDSGILYTASHGIRRQAVHSRRDQTSRYLRHRLKARSLPSILLPAMSQTIYWTKLANVMEKFLCWLPLSCPQGLRQKSPSLSF